MLTSALATSLLNFTYETSGDMTAAEATGFIAFMTAYMGFIIVLCLGSYILSSVGLMKVFEKAGVTSWYAWIPFLNSYKITEIAVGNGLFFLLMFIPSVGSLIWVIILGVKLAPAFGKGAGITILTIFLTPVAYLVLGFGDAQYVGPQKI